MAESTTPLRPPDRTGVELWDERAKAPVPGWDAAMWKSRESQLVRFAAVAEHVEPGDSVLDWGCGPGNLASYLVGKVGGNIGYVGADPSPEMLRRARQTYEAGTEGFVQYASAAELPPERYDWVLAVGPWNVRPATPMLALHELAALFERCRVGISASLLRRRGRDPIDPPHVRHEATDLARLANRLSDRWVIRGDHKANDLVVTIWRDER